MRMNNGQWINVLIEQGLTVRLRIEPSVITSGAYVALIGKSGQREAWHLTDDKTYALIAALQGTLSEPS